MSTRRAPGATVPTARGLRAVGLLLFLLFAVELGAAAAADSQRDYAPRAGMAAWGPRHPLPRTLPLLGGDAQFLPPAPLALAAPAPAQAVRQHPAATAAPAHRRVRSARSPRGPPRTA